MRKNRYSLKHIAEISGVSLSSVSRALDPARCHLVRPVVREKINKCVDETNFSVNLSARRLRLSKAEVITVIVYLDSFKPRNFSVEFVSPGAGRDDIQCLSAAIKAHRYDMKIEFIAPGQQLPLYIFDRHRTDGVIFVSYYGTEYVEHLAKIRLPNLYMSRYIDTNRRDVGLVGLNREPGYRKAIELLLGEGRRRFAWFSPRMVTPLRVNVNIINELFHEYGVFDEKLFLTNISSYYDIQDVLGKRDIADVIFCSNDAIANWVVRELRRNGVRVPDDVAVVGYDNDPAFQGANSNNLATIDAPKAMMAEIAVAQLLEIIDADNATARPHVLLDTVFIPGATALIQKPHEKGD